MGTEFFVGVNGIAALGTEFQENHQSDQLSTLFSRDGEKRFCFYEQGIFPFVPEDPVFVDLINVIAGPAVS